jgi:hypothetical protein
VPGPPDVPALADVVLAHYGGVPETLTIALPITIFAGFMLVEKRARRRERERADAEQKAPEPGAEDLTGA